MHLAICLISYHNYSLCCMLYLFKNEMSPAYVHYPSSFELTNIGLVDFLYKATSLQQILDALTTAKCNCLMALKITKYRL